MKLERELPFFLETIIVKFIQERKGMNPKPVVKVDE